MQKVNSNPGVHLAGYLITFIGAVLFSTKAIIVKFAFAHTKMDAITLLTLRMLFSLPFYLFTAFFISHKASTIKMSKQQWLYIIVIGLLGYYLSSLFDFLGLQYISAGIERLILFLYPTFVVLINALVFKLKITRHQLIALIFTYSGIGIAYFGEWHIDTGNSGFVWGSLLVFICAITYALYIVGSGKLIPLVGDKQFTAYTMLAATTGIFIHFSVTNNFHSLYQNSNTWWYGIMLAIVATVIPSFLLSNGMKKIGSNNAAIISSIGPVSTIVQAHYFLGEKIFLEQIIGTVLVVTGILILSIRGKK